MGSAAYNSMDRLEQFLRKFLPGNGQNPACAIRDEEAGRQGKGDAEDTVRASEEHRNFVPIAGRLGRICPLMLPVFRTAYVRSAKKK